MRRSILLLIFAARAFGIAHTFIAASGNVNVAGNWSPASVPGIGDTAAIPAGDHAIVPAGFTWHVGTCPASFSAGSPDISITATSSSNATLEVAAGGIFEPCGFVLLDNFAGTPLTRAGWSTFQLDTGGTLNWDENGGSLAYYFFNTNFYEQNRLILGAPGDICGLALGSCPTQVSCVNCSAAHPRLGGSSADTFPDALFLSLYGVGLSNCGDASNGCVYVGTEGQLNPLLTIDGSIFSSTGGLHTDFLATATVTNVTNTRFVNSLGTTMWGGNNVSVRTASQIYNNYFDVVFGNASMVVGANYTNNAFAGGFTSAGNQAIGAYTSWTNNWVRRVGVCTETNIFQFAALDNENTYVTCDAGGGFGSSAHIAILNTTSLTGGSSTLINNYISEILDGTSMAEGHPLILTATGVTNLVTVTNFISHLTTVTGLTAGQISTPDPGLVGVTMSPISIRHSIEVGDGVYGWFVTLGHSEIFPTNQLVSDFRYNIANGTTSTNTDNLMITTPPAYGAANTSPAGIVNSSSVDYNVPFNSKTGTIFVMGFDTNCSPSLTQGKFYSYCEASVTPGAHDLAVDPKLLEPTRGLLSWAVRHGQAATVAGAQAVFQSASTAQFGALLSDLFTYVITGHKPLNTTLWQRNDDGSTPGVCQPVMFPMPGAMRQCR